LEASIHRLVTRRSLLLSGFALATGGIAVGVVRLAPPTRGFAVLSHREVEIVEALARVLFPPGFFPVHGGDGGTAPMVDQLLDTTFPHQAVVPFRYVLRAISLGTLIARGRDFADLPPEEAAEIVAIWAGDDPLPRRLASDSVKLILGMGFLRRPEVLASIGFKAECLDPSIAPAPPVSL